jgi:predicted ATPase
LGALLQLPIPDNEITAPLEARLRKSSLEALLTGCLRHFCKDGRTLLLLMEDCHWLDPLSQDLLNLLARTVANLPVFIIVTQRPMTTGDPQLTELRQLPHFSEIVLDAFSRVEAESLVKMKLSQLFEFNGPSPVELLELLVTRSSGNPFYLEELLNFLKDQRIDFQDARALAQLELPASLHTLILSRIDRLTESQQASLKVASVIGRLFPAAVLWGMQTESGKDNVLSDLKALCAVDLTALDRPEPEWVYIFKHVVTQEVVYESLPHATRSKLHNGIGVCLEQLHADRVEQYLDLLAFHFDHGTDISKRRDYLLMAGGAAQVRYANTAAISYYERVLPLLSPLEAIPTLLKLGKVLELTGAWKKAVLATRRLLRLPSKLGIVNPSAMPGGHRRPAPEAGPFRRVQRLARTCPFKFDEIGTRQEWGRASTRRAPSLPCKGIIPKPGDSMNEAWLSGGR